MLPKLRLYVLIIILFFLKYAYCQRRIVKGTRTHAEKRYMVYLIKWYKLLEPHDSWLCGGALVTRTQILTSAACIIDIDNMYAIAGYKKYVNGLDIYKDNCTRVKKKRIVKIRVPRENVVHLNEYKNTTRWMTLDIGIATVEKPYDFHDVTYRIYCSYIPATIEINYNTHLDETIGTNVVALGWGRDRGALPDDVVDRNSEYLREVSIKIKNKKYCIDKFKGNGLTELIQNYMICTHDKGLLDGEGYLIEENKSLRTRNNNFEDNKGLRTRNNNFRGSFVESVEEDEPVFGPSYRKETDDDDVLLTFSTRKSFRNNTHKRYTQHHNRNDNTSNARTLMGTRRQGICQVVRDVDDVTIDLRRSQLLRGRKVCYLCIQNDHGGPLVTWIGKTELLIGVAVNSLYDENFECIGPYLFTSTSAAGQIVRCLLSNQESSPRTCLDKNDRYHIMEQLVKHTETNDKPHFKKNTKEATTPHMKGQTEAQTKASTDTNKGHLNDIIFWSNNSEHTKVQADAQDKTTHTHRIKSNIEETTRTHTNAQNEAQAKASTLANKGHSYDIIFRVENSKDFLEQEIEKSISTEPEVCVCQRKITHGSYIPNGKKYMVYLLNSPYSKHQPDSWLCGGAIISRIHILTAAACLTEVTHIYVIAGYKKYVNVENLEDDECTRTKKQKIVKIIIPKAYNKENWLKYDIGLGIVKEPYDFFDMTYRKICSYEPGAISINYDVKYEELDVAAAAFGWGGLKARAPGLSTNINSRYLREARTVITNVSICRTHFTNVVDYHFLCSNGSKNEASDIKEVVNTVEFCMEECDTDANDSADNECFLAEDMPSRRKFNCSERKFNQPYNSIDDKDIKLSKIIQGRNYTDKIIRRQIQNAGICQNDHGGPLVTWTGASEVTIGVALTSVYNYKYECQGPFLYTSTARSSVLIKCLLSDDEKTRDVCDSLKKGVKEYNVKWPEKESMRERGEIRVEPNKEETVTKANKSEKKILHNDHEIVAVHIRPQIQLSSLLVNVSSIIKHVLRT